MNSVCWICRTLIALALCFGLSIAFVKLRSPNTQPDTLDQLIVAYPNHYPPNDATLTHPIGQASLRVAPAILEEPCEGIYWNGQTQVL